MRYLWIVALLSLSACGNTAIKKIGSDYNASLDAYKACVRASGPEGCRREKAILDADAQRYQSMWAAINGATQASGSDGPAVYQPIGGGTYIRY
jgi:hypothetical protein